MKSLIFWLLLIFDCVILSYGIWDTFFPTRPPARPPRRHHSNQRPKHFNPSPSIFESINLTPSPNLLPLANLFNLSPTRRPYPVKSSSAYGPPKSFSDIFTGPQQNPDYVLVKSHKKKPPPLPHRHSINPIPLFVTASSTTNPPTSTVSWSSTLRRSTPTTMKWNTLKTTKRLTTFKTTKRRTTSETPRKTTSTISTFDISTEPSTSTSLLTPVDYSTTTASTFSAKEIDFGSDFSFNTPLMFSSPPPIIKDPTKKRSISFVSRSPSSTKRTTYAPKNIAKSQIMNIQELIASPYVPPLFEVKSAIINSQGTPLHAKVHFFQNDETQISSSTTSSTTTTPATTIPTSTSSASIENLLSFITPLIEQEKKNLVTHIPKEKSLFVTPFPSGRTPIRRRRKHPYSRRKELIKYSRTSTELPKTTTSDGSFVITTSFSEQDSLKDKLKRRVKYLRSQGFSRNARKASYPSPAPTSFEDLIVTTKSPNYRSKKRKKPLSHYRTFQSRHKKRQDTSVIPTLTLRNKTKPQITKSSLPSGSSSSPTMIFSSDSITDSSDFYSSNEQKHSYSSTNMMSDLFNSQEESVDRIFSPKIINLVKKPFDSISRPIKKIVKKLFAPKKKKKKIQPQVFIPAATHFSPQSTASTTFAVPFSSSTFASQPTESISFSTLAKLPTYAPTKLSNFKSTTAINEVQITPPSTTINPFLHYTKKSTKKSINFHKTNGKLSSSLNANKQKGHSQFTSFRNNPFLLNQQRNPTKPSNSFLLPFNTIRKNPKSTTINPFLRNTNKLTTTTRPEFTDPQPKEGDNFVFVHYPITENPTFYSSSSPATTSSTLRTIKPYVTISRTPSSTTTQAYSTINGHGYYTGPILPSSTTRTTTTTIQNPFLRVNPNSVSVGTYGTPIQDNRQHTFENVVKRPPKLKYDNNGSDSLNAPKITEHLSTGNDGSVLKNYKTLNRNTINSNVSSIIRPTKTTTSYTLPKSTTIYSARTSTTTNFPPSLNLSPNANSNGGMTSSYKTNNEQRPISFSQPITNSPENKISSPYTTSAYRTSINPPTVVLNPYDPNVKNYSLKYENSGAGGTIQQSVNLLINFLLKNDPKENKNEITGYFTTSSPQTIQTVISSPRYLSPESIASPIKTTLPALSTSRVTSAYASTTKLVDKYSIPKVTKKISANNYNPPFQRSSVINNSLQYRPPVTTILAKEYEIPTTTSFRQSHSPVISPVTITALESYATQNTKPIYESSIITELPEINRDYSSPSIETKHLATSINTKPININKKTHVSVAASSINYSPRMANSKKKETKEYSDHIVNPSVSLIYKTRPKTPSLGLNYESRVVNRLSRTRNEPLRANRNKNTRPHVSQTTAPYHKVRNDYDERTTKRKHFTTPKRTISSRYQPYKTKKDSLLISQNNNNPENQNQKYVFHSKSILKSLPMRRLPSSSIYTPSPKKHIYKPSSYYDTEEYVSSEDADYEYYYEDKTQPYTEKPYLSSHDGRPSSPHSSKPLSSHPSSKLSSNYWHKNSESIYPELRGLLRPSNWDVKDFRGWQNYFEIPGDIDGEPRPPPALETTTSSNDFGGLGIGYRDWLKQSEVESFGTSSFNDGGFSNIFGKGFSRRKDNDPETQDHRKSFSIHPRKGLFYANQEKSDTSFEVKEPSVKDLNVSSPPSQSELLKAGLNQLTTAIFNTLF